MRSDDSETCGIFGAWGVHLSDFGHQHPCIIIAQCSSIVWISRASKLGSYLCFGSDGNRAPSNVRVEWKCCQIQNAFRQIAAATCPVTQFDGKVARLAM